MRARAKFDRAIWKMLNPSGKAPADPLVGDQSAADDAVAAPREAVREAREVQRHVFVVPNLTPDEALKLAQQKLAELTRHERVLVAEYYQRVFGKDLPESVRNGQRITTMTSGQKNILCVGSPFKFQKFGSSQMDLSELLPHLSKVVDDCTFVRSIHTDPINHDPAVTFFASGHQQPGRPDLCNGIGFGQ